METIAINLLWVSPRDKTGAFIYVENLLNALFETKTRTNFVLIIRWQDRWFFRTTYRENPRVRVYISDPRPDLYRNPLRSLAKIWYKLHHNETGLERLIAKELTQTGKELGFKKMFFPTQIIYPQGLDNTEHYVTILDLQHEYLPENFSATELERRRQNTVHVTKTAKHLFAISAYTKETLQEKMLVPPEKITVTPLAPNAKQIVQEKIDLPKTFMFYPAALWPHKNHRLAIDVAHRLSGTFPDLHLVFSGAIKKKGLKEELDKLIRRYQLDGRVHFLGFVSDGVVEYVYSQASVMIFPSKFEGFGMPILEAYRHNLPVVAARNSSITEVAGGAAVLCETSNVDAFTKAVEAILTNKTQRDQLQPKMAQQLAKFSWQKTAQLTINKLLDK